MVQHLSSSRNLETATKSGKSVAIPLPSPPSQFMNGNACGGNQSFLPSANSLTMGTPLLSDPTKYWESNGTTSSSNAGVRSPGVVGLTNIGNTCFMNSGLQCLINTPSISEFFLKSKTFNANLQNLSLLNHFQYVIKQAWYGPSSKINVHDFKNCLAAIHSQFSDSRQHDCQEFLALLLDSLHEQLKNMSDSQKELQDSDNFKPGEAAPTNAIVRRPATPASWLRHEDYCVDNESYSVEDVVSCTKTRRTKSLPDVAFSVSRNKAAKLSPRALKHLHSGQRSQYIVGNRSSNVQVKHNLKSKSPKLRGAPISLFRLPNFTPPGHSYLNCDEIANGADVKENKWMDLKSERTFLSENRKKKIDSSDSLGLYKKPKLDSPPSHLLAPETKRNISFPPEEHETEKEARCDPNLSDDSLPVPSPDCKSDKEYSTQRNGDILLSKEKIKKPPELLNNDKEAEKANIFWKKYMQNNNSVIAKTFQGLLKSTVVCAVCNYNSVTYEPFMYLSLPFPRVLERKLTIWFISMKHRIPFKLEFVAGLMDTVKKVKYEVGSRVPIDCRSEESLEKLLVAEVLNHCVHRLIDDSTLVRQLNNNRNLYVFELNDNFDDRYNSKPVLFNGGIHSFSNQFVIADPISSTTQGQMNASTYLDEDWDQDCKLQVPHEVDALNISDHTTDTSISSNVKVTDDGANCDKTAGSDLPAFEGADLNLVCNPPRSSLSLDEKTATKDNSGCDNTLDEDRREIDTSWPDDVCTMQPSMSTETDVSALRSADDVSVPELISQEKSTGNDGQSFSASVSSTVGCADASCENLQSSTMQCIICLEDCLVSEMKQHTGCDCVICANCVASSIQHFGEPEEANLSDKLKCATCMKIVDGSEFIPYVSSLENGVSKATMVFIPIVFRLDTNPDKNTSPEGQRIFGYPWLVKIPSSLPAKEFDDYIAAINPLPQSKFRVLSVTADGKSCGRCGYASSCSGCDFPKVGEVSLRFKTSIAIAYTDLNPGLLASIQPTDMAIEEHSFGSPSWGIPSEPNYDIHECLRAFFETEHLDEKNPWYCPHCEKNQWAKKTLSVCHFPDYLIVYLKRFFFLDHASNKLNNKLRFPVNELDVGEYMAPEFIGKDWKYDLYGCVCHFGSVSSGHYTAFGKNPASGDWHYFNDDVVSPQCPKDLEHSSAYVLFYAKKGVPYDIPLQTKARPLPALNTLIISRPTHVVNLINNENEACEQVDDLEVSSSSTELCSFKTQPIHCSYGGGVVDAAEEMRSLDDKKKSIPRCTADIDDYVCDEIEDIICPTVVSLK